MAERLLLLVLLLPILSPVVLPQVVQTAFRPSNVSLGVVFSDNDVLLQSENGEFQLEFRQWELNSSTSQCMAGVRYTHKSPTALIWSTFNIDQPWNLTNCTLELDTTGVLKALLTFTNGYVLIPWQTNTSGLGVQTLFLQNDGNFVLLNLHGEIVWQSFGSFNDLFLIPSGMKFFANNTLYERFQVPEYPDFTVPGRFGMRINSFQRLLTLFTTDNKFVYYAFGPGSSSASNNAMLDYVVINENLNFYDNRSSLIGSINYNVNGVHTVPYGNELIGSGMFEYNGTGNFLINYLNMSTKSHVLYYNSSISNICDYPFSCGDYGLCNEITGQCSCPPGFKSQGGDGKHCIASDSRYYMHPIQVVFHEQFVSLPVTSQDHCRNTCVWNVSCNVALFDAETSTCAHFPIIHTIRQASKRNGGQVMFIKTQIHEQIVVSSIVVTATVTFAAFVLTSSLVVWTMWQRCQSGHKKMSENDDLDILQGLDRLPTRFSYKDLQAATNDFSKMLGQGGTASVYEGLLDIGGATRKVAVKKLELSSIRGGHSTDQFKAEVATIGSVSHINLVKLKGFCMEGTSRLLVYEYMDMGSLDRWLFQSPSQRISMSSTNASKESKPKTASCQFASYSNKRLLDENDIGQNNEPFILSWETRCRIALNTARALEYLHHQCGDHIVHCDIKPQNILLDEKFNAKLSDFGLAKTICQDKDSLTMTTLKGTRGYLPPEWLLNSSITTKSDVYSYGVVLLNLITGRKSIDPEHGHLTTWAMRTVREAMELDVEVRDEITSVGSDHQLGHASSLMLKEIMLDPCCETAGEVDLHAFEKMLILALSCVQRDPSHRPNMSSVVQTLETLNGVNNIDEAVVPMCTLVPSALRPVSSFNLQSGNASPVSTVQ